MNSTPPLPSRSTYVQTVLEAYLKLPETPLRSRPADRRLAHQLYDRALPLKTIQTALLLASARRLTRESQALPLQPIRSLYYFVPVIEEVLPLPLPDNYLRYLKLKMRSLVPTQKLNSSSSPPAASVQKSAFSRDR